MYVCMCVCVLENVSIRMWSSIRVINAKSLLSLSSLLIVTKLGLMLQPMNFTGVYEIFVSAYE